jgi:ankyrin repeat protein
VVLVGCGPSVDIHQAVNDGNIEAVKQHLDAGTDVNAKDDGLTPLHEAITVIFA